MKPIYTILTALVMCAATGSASADTVITNLSKPSGNGLTVTSSFSSGQAFTTGSTAPGGATATGWTLDSLSFRARYSSGSGDLVVMLYSDESGNPGTLLGSFVGTNPGASFADITFTPITNITLDVNTSYFAVLSATGTSEYEWQETNTEETGLFDWSIANKSRQSVLSTFPEYDGFPLHMAVNATAIPEPSAALLSLAVLGTLFVRRRS